MSACRSDAEKSGIRRNIVRLANPKNANTTTNNTSVINGE